MTKIKTSELTDAALNYAVAQCENPEWEAEGWRVNCTYPDDDGWVYNPATDWSQGGPIIEREKIATDYDHDTWNAAKYGLPWCVSGPTALIAAMRCYVQSKLGDEVDVPEELL